MRTKSATIAGDAANLARGGLMGAANIVPGVSGGTVALLLGIYPRLLTAISQVDRQFFRLLGQRDWRAAAEHLDLRFLTTLLVGVLGGIAALAGGIHFLLSNHRQATMAAFFGLILASTLPVARMVRPQGSYQKVRCALFCAAAALAAKWLVSGELLHPQPGLPFVFLCGMIAICTMILPGISGAYILMLMGKYEEITDIIHRLLRLDVSLGDLALLAVFTAGCAIGLLLFSKALKGLLARYPAETMATLGGFMIGALWKIWPFQALRIPGEVIDKHSITDPYWPSAWTGNVGTCVGIAVAAFALVLVVDAIASRLGPSAEELGSGA